MSSDDDVDDDVDDHAPAALLVPVQYSMSASAMSFFRASTSLGSESAYYATEPATTSTPTPPELAGPLGTPTPCAPTYHNLENVNRPVEPAQTTSALQAPRRFTVHTGCRFRTVPDGGHVNQWNRPGQAVRVLPSTQDEVEPTSDPDDPNEVGSPSVPVHGGTGHRDQG